jgi:uncharacterized membrane protein YfcA
MSLFNFPPQIMASTALTLNILVSGVSFSSFYRAGHMRRDLLLPFLVTSLPAAFIGGYFKITDQVYAILLYLVLTFVAIRLLVFSKPKEDDQPLRPLPLVPVLLIGLVIGLLSGMVGIGGGIFLSPIIIFAHWGTSKQASAVSALFITLNSISGLLGRVIAGKFMLDTFSLTVLPLGLVGALVGGFLGARHLSGTTLRRFLGVVMTMVVTNFWLTFWK